MKMEEATKKREIELALQKIEDMVEAGSEEGRRNRIGVRYFLLYLLVGGNETDGRILTRKVKNLLSDPRSCAVVSLNSADGPVSEDSVIQSIDKILLQAGKNYVEVNDLNKVIVCPVIFSASPEVKKAPSLIATVGRRIQDKGKSVIWQPFLLICDDVELYGNIYAGLRYMQGFIAEKKNDPSEGINRCCLLSDKDDKGFYVEQESLLQTVALISVMHNSTLKNPDELGAIAHKVSLNDNDKEKENYFYTARAAAIVNPKVSYTLQRIDVAFRFFSGSIDETASGAIRDIEYKTICQILEPYLKKLPVRNGKVTMYPIYGVMCDPVKGRQTMERLIEEKYKAPFETKEARRALNLRALSWFFSKYLEKNGSLQKLKELIENGTLSNELEEARKGQGGAGNIVLETGFDDIDWKNEKLAEIAGPYRHTVNDVQKYLCSKPEKLLTGLPQNVSYVMPRVNAILESFHDVEETVKNHQRVVQKSSIVIPVGQTSLRSSFSETEEGWIKEQSMHPEFKQLNHKFDETVKNILFGVSGAGIKDLLFICYDAVKEQTFGDRDYIRRLSEEAGANHTIVEKNKEEIDDNTRFTIRFFGRSAQNDVLCIVGAPENEFYKVLKESYKGIGFDQDNFDRIDLLRISAPFDLKVVDAWERIEKKGEGHSETA